MQNESQNAQPKKSIPAFLVAVILTICVLVICVETGFRLYNQWHVPSQTLRITQLNIGQGDALLIRTPQGKDILVDAGRDRTVLSEMGGSLAPWNRTIEYVIGTHDDADHVGGMPFVERYYKVRQYIVNDHPKPTPESDAFRQIIENSGAQTQIARTGDTIMIEENITLEIIHPVPEEHHEDINEDSIVAILRYKNFSLMLTGDAGLPAEEEILKRCAPDCSSLNVTMLKVGHHGSKGSSGASFLSAVSPQIALISAGIDNRYGHPHQSVIDRLSSNNIPYFRSDTQGRIVCETEGEDAAMCTSAQ